ncbi:MAG: hypothetical protein ACE5E8_11380 [Acidimicrobiia bacterium]
MVNKVDPKKLYRLRAGFGALRVGVPTGKKTKKLVGNEQNARGEWVDVYETVDDSQRRMISPGEVLQGSDPVFKIKDPKDHERDLCRQFEEVTA